MRTALQKLINSLILLKELYEPGTPSHDAYSLAIKEAKGQMLLEKKQIVDAFTAGQKDILEVLVEEVNSRWWNRLFRLRIDIPADDTEDGEEYYKQNFL